MNETLLRNWVRKMLHEQQGEQPVSYKPSCAYEIKINTMLQNAGLRDQYTPGSTPGFCFGTDSGADGKFQGPDGTTYNLEMKDGRSQAAVAMEEPLREEVLELISKLEGYNTVPYITELINAQLSTGNMKGLNCGRSLCPPNLNLTPADINGLAQQIQAAQTPEIRALKEALQKPGSELPNFTLYYYFGRTKKAAQELKISDVPPVGEPSDMDTGKWTAHYNSSNTYYIQIGGSGLFHMGSDPAGLGVPAFDGSVTLGSRIRFKASSGNSPIGGRGGNTYVTESGQEISLGGRRFEVTPTVDLRAGGSSPINLDTDAGINALREKLGYGAVNENIIRKLVRQVLLEGRGEDFEKFLAASLIQAGGPIKASVQRGSDYDVDLFKGDKSARVEVKLSDTDQLGKIKKKALSSFVFNFEKDRFEYARDKAALSKGTPTSQRFADDKYDFITPLMDSAISALNDPAVIEFFKTTVPGCTKDTGTIDLRGRTRETSLSRMGVDSSYPAATKKQLCPMTVPVVNDDDSLEVEEEYREVTANVPGSVMSAMMKSKCDYLLIGDNDSKSFSGRIGTVGNGDPLGLGVAPIEFGDIGIEIRWGNKASEAAPSHSFTLETRAKSISGGTAFSSPQDFPGNKKPRRRKKKPNK